MTTKIQNNNIKDLVYKYIYYKDYLPVDLKEKKINDWNVSAVKDMSELFMNYEDFNEPLEDWDVSKVTTMHRMFNGCKRFNQPLAKWGNKVQKVNVMTQMFDGCTEFNQPLEDWELKKVTGMLAMFKDCTKFNQPLAKWGKMVKNVTRFSGMFRNCTVFNQPLYSWNVKKARVMSHMFSGCENFNQPLFSDFSDLRNTSGMFMGCTNFDQPLDKWGEHLSLVHNMSEMFKGCTNFDQPLKKWDVKKVDNMTEMFMDCKKFDQDLQNWQLDSIAEKFSNIFLNCKIREVYKPARFRDEPISSFKEYEKQINDLRLPPREKKTPYLVEEISSDCNGDTKDILSLEDLENLKTIVLNDNHCYSIDTLATLYNKTEISKSLFTQLPWTQRDKEIMELCFHYKKTEMKKNSRARSRSRSNSRTRGGKRHQTKKRKLSR